MERSCAAPTRSETISHLVRQWSPCNRARTYSSRVFHSRTGKSLERPSQIERHHVLISDDGDVFRCHSYFSCLTVNRGVVSGLTSIRQFRTTGSTYPHNVLNTGLMSFKTSLPESTLQAAKSPLARSSSCETERFGCRYWPVILLTSALCMIRLARFAQCCRHRHGTAP